MGDESRRLAAVDANLSERLALARTGALLKRLKVFHPHRR